MNTQQPITDFDAFRTWVTTAKTPVVVAAADGTRLGAYKLTSISGARGTQTWTATRSRANGTIRMAATNRFRTAEAAVAWLLRPTDSPAGV